MGCLGFLFLPFDFISETLYIISEPFTSEELPRLGNKEWIAAVISFLLFTIAGIVLLVINW